MDNISKRIAFLEKKLKLLEFEKKIILKELKDNRKICNHDYLVGGITTKNDEIYYCLSCGEKVFRSKTSAKIMIDIKDYLTLEEYTSSKFADLFNEYYNLAKKKFNKMVLDDIPEELIEAVLYNELVYFLEEYRNKDRGR
jgi:hypothetical protein